MTNLNDIIISSIDVSSDLQCLKLAKSFANFRIRKLHASNAKAITADCSERMGCYMSYRNTHVHIRSRMRA